MFLIYLRSLLSEEGSWTRDVFWCNFGISCAVRLILRFVGSTEQLGEEFSSSCAKSCPQHYWGRNDIEFFRDQGMNICLRKDHQVNFEHRCLWEEPCSFGIDGWKSEAEQLPWKRETRREGWCAESICQNWAVENLEQKSRNVCVWGLSLERQEWGRILLN